MTRACVLLALLLAAMVGCGTSGSGASQPPSPSSAPTANAELGLSAAHVINDAQAATAAASSFHIKGMLNSGITVDADVTANGDAEGAVTYAGITWSFLAIGGRTYFKGSTIWQRTQTATVAAAIGDRWVHVDTTIGFWSLSVVMPAIRQVVLQDVLGPHPGLNNVGRDPLTGVAAVRVESPSDRYWIAANGPPYLLRWIDVKESSPSGVCGFDLSNFGLPVTITAPSGAIELGGVGAVISPLPAPSAEGA